jgi:hypothetical protein
VRGNPLCGSYLFGMKNCDDRSKTGNRALNFASLFQDKEEIELLLRHSTFVVQYERFYCFAFLLKKKIATIEEKQEIEP